MNQSEGSKNTERGRKNSHKLLLDTVYIAMFAAIIAICAHIRIPLHPIPFTMQTLGVFLTSGILGFKRGTVSVLVYILLGAVGLPVFNGFAGGLGVLFGVTGGYIIGFIFTAIVVGIASDLGRKKVWILIVSMIVGTVLYYVFGTAWYIFVTNSQGNTINITAALSNCVIPFLIPDAAKIAVAVILVNRLNKIIKL